MAWKQPRVFTDRWIAKENVYLHKENIIRPLKKKKKKEILPYATTRTWEDIRLSEISQTQKHDTARYHLCVESEKVDLAEADSRTVLARGWESTGRWGRWCGQGHKTFTVKMNKFWGST